MNHVIFEADGYSLCEDRPAWYWSRGLHDAQILCKKSHRYEYGESIYYNCIKFTIDAEQAMFDTSVLEIIFYNCKELTPEVIVENTVWKTDKLWKKGRKFRLDLKATSRREDRCYSIQFEYCEVNRR